MPGNMLVIGKDASTSNTSITIDLESLKHHTLIFGQSGSGKSFLIARLIEEILLRTAARVLIVDPNGDFRKISFPSDKTWKSDQFKPTFSEFFNDFDSEYDQEEKFQKRWSQVRFVFLNPGLHSPKDAGNVFERRLLVHWDSLDDDLQRFLLVDRR